MFPPPAVPSKPPASPRRARPGSREAGIRRIRSCHRKNTGFSGRHYCTDVGLCKSLFHKLSGSAGCGIPVGENTRIRRKLCLGTGPPGSCATVPDDRRQNDPSDDGWAIVEPMPPKRGNMGRPCGVSLRSVFDGVRHILSNGRRWRALPTDIHRIPPTGTVSTSGARAVRRACPDSLRDLARQCAGRSPEPTAAAIDSRSMKTTGSGGPRGHHAGGKVRGRKRHVAADLGGTPVAVMVHAAGIQDRDGAPDIIAKSPVTAPDVRGPLADGGHPDPKPRERPDGTGPADIIGTVGKPEDVKGFTVPRRHPPIPHPPRGAGAEPSESNS